MECELISTRQYTKECTQRHTLRHTIFKTQRRKFQTHIQARRPCMKAQRHKTERHISTLYTTQPAAGSGCTDTHTRAGQFIFSIPRSRLALLDNNKNKLSVYFALFFHEYFIYFPIWVNMMAFLQLGNRK